jgi:hypothetical protein
MVFLGWFVGGGHDLQRLRSYWRADSIDHRARGIIRAERALWQVNYGEKDYCVFWVSRFGLDRFHPIPI